MSRLVLAIMGADGEGVIAHRMFNSFPVTLGRAYDNDMILSDPYVAAQQARISLRDDGAWQIEDLSNGNPLRVNGRAVAGLVRCASGDTLQIGATQVGLFSPAHPVAPPALLEPQGGGLLSLAEPARVWSLFGIMVLVVVLWSYAAVWNEKPDLVMASVAAIVSMVVVVWSGLWSVAGRLAHKPSAFKGQVAVASLYIMLLFVVWLLGSWTAFLLDENAFSQAFSYLLDSCALMFLVYGALTLATRMPQRRRTAAAAFCAFGLAIGVFTISLVAARNFTPDLPTPLMLKPYLAPAVSPVPLEDFMRENAELFASKKLKTP